MKDRIDILNKVQERIDILNKVQDKLCLLDPINVKDEWLSAIMRADQRRGGDIENSVNCQIANGEVLKLIIKQRCKEVKEEAEAFARAKGLLLNFYKED